MRTARPLSPSLLPVTACPNAGAAEPTNLFRVYYLGNSVTDTIRYGELATLAATRGVKLTWGRQMIPGAPLEWLYTHPNDGFREEPYGTIPPALATKIQNTARKVVRTHPDAGIAQPENLHR